MSRGRVHGGQARTVASLRLRGASVSDAMIRCPKLLGPTATVAQVRELFGDDHVHVALVVHRGKLLAVIDPSDLTDALPASSLARAAGCLHGRVTRPDADLAATWEIMTALGRRRLAVTDRHGTFLGLLCLKRSRLGFCSNADVRARAQEPRHGRAPVQG